MDFAHFVGVTTFAPNMWRRTMYNYYKMLSSEDSIGEQWKASIYSVLKKCF